MDAQNQRHQQLVQAVKESTSTQSAWSQHLHNELSKLGKYFKEDQPTEVKQQMTFSAIEVVPGPRAGLVYNGCYVSDGDVGKKIDVKAPGVGTYTVTLVSGWNQLNVDSEAVITADTSTDQISVLFKWMNFNFS